MTHYISIPEAIRLTGVSRRTLYRDMTAGKLSYTTDARGRRCFTGEALTALYGSVPGVAQLVSHSGTDEPPDTERHTVAHPDPAALLEALQVLSGQVQAMREELAELRAQASHKALPAPSPPADDPHGLRAMVAALRGEGD